MPIVFVFSGFVFITLMFNVIEINNKKIKFNTMLIMVLICCSYFVGDISFSFLSFNVLSLSAVIMVLFINRIKNISVLDIFLIIFVAVVYKVFLDKDINNMLTFDNSIALILVGLFSILYLNHPKKGIHFVVMISCVCLLLSVNTGINNFGFSMMNYNFVFEAMIVYVLMLIIYQGIINVFKFNKGYRYGQKTNYISDFTINGNIG